MSHANGNGKTHEHEPDQVMQARFDRALADMPDRTQLDKLARFTTEQDERLRRLIEAQANAMFDLFELMRQRISLLDGEIARLKAERHGGPKPNGGGAAQRQS